MHHLPYHVIHLQQKKYPIFLNQSVLFYEEHEQKYSIKLQNLILCLNVLNHFYIIDLIFSKNQRVFIILFCYSSFSFRKTILSYTYAYRVRAFAVFIKRIVFITKPIISFNIYTNNRLYKIVRLFSRRFQEW